LSFLYTSTARYAPAKVVHNKATVTAKRGHGKSAGVLRTNKGRSGQRRD
jgi:hypothetical protein